MRFQECIVTEKLLHIQADCNGGLHGRLYPVAPTGYHSQRGSHALWSHVTPAANKTLADLGLRGASTNALLLRGTFELSRLSSGINVTQWSWAERDLQEI